MRSNAERRRWLSSSTGIPFPLWHPRTVISKISIVHRLPASVRLRSADMSGLPPAIYQELPLLRNASLAVPGKVRFQFIQLSAPPAAKGDDIVLALKHLPH